MKHLSFQVQEASVKWQQKECKIQRNGCSSGERVLQTLAKQLCLAVSHYLASPVGFLPEAEAVCQAVAEQGRPALWLDSAC